MSALPFIARAPRIAIVSDAISQAGSAESVLEAMAEAFPAAPIFTPLCDPAYVSPALRTRITESWLGRLPRAARRARALLPLYPLAIESFNLDDYDIILSSHHSFAKGLLRSSDQIHVSYCHTPMRALWERPHEEIQGAPPLLRPAARTLLFSLRSWDAAAASRVDYFIANTRITRDRIEMHYRRDSDVLYPPIDTDAFTPTFEPPGDYYLVASRNLPYKRIDLAIDACTRLNHRLIVVGPDTQRLAFPSEIVSFYGAVDRERLLGLMRHAKALISPQRDDFARTPLEVNACGRPVIAYAAGGALETVDDGRTGVLFNQQTVDSLAHTIERFESLPFNPAILRTHAEMFSKPRFIRALRSTIDEVWDIRRTHNARFRSIPLAKNL